MLISAEFGPSGQSWADFPFKFNFSDISFLVFKRKYLKNLIYVINIIYIWIVIYAYNFIYYCISIKISRKKSAIFNFFPGPRNNKNADFLKKASRRNRRDRISLQYPYIFNWIWAIWCLGTISRKFNFSDISFLRENISKT